MDGTTAYGLGRVGECIVGSSVTFLIREANRSLRRREDFSAARRTPLPPVRDSRTA